ncbi:MAG: carbon starvation CstA family protein [Candidatus Competibacteraceae bacterium]
MACTTNYCRISGWLFVAVLGAFALGAVALCRGETVSAVWLVTAALCIYASVTALQRVLFERVIQLDDTRMTPAVVRITSGLDYVPTNKWVLYGHHFAAIAGGGPLVGPVLAAPDGPPAEHYHKFWPA